MSVKNVRLIKLFDTQYHPTGLGGIGIKRDIIAALKVEPAFDVFSAVNNRDIIVDRDGKAWRWDDTSDDLNTPHYERDAWSGSVLDVDTMAELAPWQPYTPSIEEMLVNGQWYWCSFTVAPKPDQPLHFLDDGKAHGKRWKNGDNYFSTKEVKPMLDDQGEPRKCTGLET
jgi:hypothetical protein